MKKKKTIWYYLSLLTVMLGIIQLFFATRDARKNYLLAKSGVEIKGIVIDKNITERTESIYTGYRLKFENPIINSGYQNRFFKSLDSHKNFGDTIAIIHYAPDLELSQLADAEDNYGSTIFNFFISFLLLIMGVLGVKKCIALGHYIEGN